MTSSLAYPVMADEPELADVLAAASPAAPVPAIELDAAVIEKKPRPPRRPPGTQIREVQIGSQ
jgi:hypothetical protein